MLLDQRTLGRIADGSVTLAFRRWKRPTVKAGGTALTSIGRLRIKAVDVVEPDAISGADAQAAGFDDARSLRELLDKRAEGQVYRIELEREGPDPRVALREQVAEGEELAALLGRLDRWAWAAGVLHLIGSRPAVRAADLAARLGMETSRFKANVRRLKGLGLTESLKVGYRLSSRGRAVLEHFERRDRAT